MGKYDDVYKKMKDKYEEITKESFNEYYDQSISNLKLNKETNKNFNKNVLLVRHIRPMKKRWVNIVKEDNKSGYNKDLEVVSFQYEKVKSKEISLEKFKDYFGVLKVEEYKKKLDLELDRWIKDDESFLIDFKYIDSLKDKSILTAINKDISLYKLSYNENQDENIRKVVTLVAGYPIDYTGKMDYLSEEQKINLREAQDIDTIMSFDKLISLEGDEKDEIRMQLEKKTYLEIKKGGNPEKYLDMMTQIALINSIKYLNSFDTKVINYYYNHFVNAVTGSPIDKTFYEIVKEMNLPNTKSYYERIEDSLAKIASIQMTYNIEGKKLFGSLFTCAIYDENGAKKARVYVSGILQDFAVKDSAFEYDKDVYDNLSDASQQLAVWLQKRRFRLALQKQGNSESIDIKTFKNAIYFNTKRQDRIRNKVLELLEELKLNNLIVLEYKFYKSIDIIAIAYIELTAREKKKLGLLEDDIVSVSENGQTKLILD